MIDKIMLAQFKNKTLSKYIKEFNTPLFF
ncbi:hypothetical protein JIP1600_690012 [Flavobacterium psychrophilum]|nr:hypothetical protein JIP1600_690012 [Flavobacterium psychrophilum]